eukprot:SM000110S18910  [mRNA]  locus=s110:194292:201225:- [translate_table: standard]
MEEYKQSVRPRLRAMLTGEWREWVLVHVGRAALSEVQARSSRRVYVRMEDDFNTKKRIRQGPKIVTPYATFSIPGLCCRLEYPNPEAAAWEEMETRVMECVRATLEQRVIFYEEEVRKLSEARFLPGFSFTNFFVIKESLAFMFEMAQLLEDALREYDELEQCYKDLVQAGRMGKSDFGGLDPGDDRAALLEHWRKPFSLFAPDKDKVRSFDFRQYLFARQASLLFALGRPAEVADRGFTFILSFSKALAANERSLPFCLKEVWTYTACVTLVRASKEKFVARTMRLDGEKEFRRIVADLVSLARAKEMDKLGTLGPTELVHEANRRRASRSAGSPGELWPDLRRSASPPPERTGSTSTQSKSRGYTSTPTSPSKSPVGSPTRSLAQAEADDLKAPGMPARRQLTLREVQLAAEAALLRSVSHKELHQALSARPAYEELYLRLTTEAAGNYSRAGRRRAAVALEGELAAVHYQKSEVEQAAPLLEKLCAAYVADRWHQLLLSALPRLADCQLALGDVSGFLHSCLKLLAVTKELEEWNLSPGAASAVAAVDRGELQRQLVDLAAGDSQPRDSTVSLDVSSLLTFAAQPGPPMELCEGDSGTLVVTVWSGFPAELNIESLSLSLTALPRPLSVEDAADGAAMRVIKASASLLLLAPGRNNVDMHVGSLRRGAYVLGAMTGLLGRVRVRSHSHCSTSAASQKGGSPDSDDALSTERSPRPTVLVAPERVLASIEAAVADGLLMGEPQWVGLALRPQGYSLGGAVLRLKAGAGLLLEDPQTAELQRLDDGIDVGAAVHRPGTEMLAFQDGQLVLPAWAADVPTVLWVRTVALRERDDLQSPGSRGVSAPASPVKPGPSPGAIPLTPRPLIPSPHSVESQLGYKLPPMPAAASGGDPGTLSRTASLAVVDGMRSLHLWLDIGADKRRYERVLDLQFTEAFRAVTRVVSGGSDGILLLQVTLKSLVSTPVTITDARLALQAGFVSAEATAEGRPDCAWLLPLTISAGSEGALLYSVQPEATMQMSSGGGSRERRLPRWLSGDFSALETRSLLRVEFDLGGDRWGGAHTPARGGALDTTTLGLPKEAPAGSSGHAPASAFYHAFVLQMPTLERKLAVGMLPLPGEEELCLGRPIVLSWRVQRLKAGRAATSSGGYSLAEDGNASRQDGDVAGSDAEEELFYEVKANVEQWMVTGRKKGRLLLAGTALAVTVVHVACIPVVTGYVHPPALRLPAVDRASISHSPAGLHLVCVLPPSPCSSYCITKRL